MGGYRVSKITIFVILAVSIVYLIYGTFFKEGPRFGVGAMPSSVRGSTDPLETGLDQILINLSKGQYSFLKAEIAVKAENRAAKAEIDRLREPLRRLVLNIASKEDGEILATPQGKEQFKARIIQEARQQLGLELEGVYFQNFVLAR
ncbi:MAG: flagellar basal body-associated FliL family protein [Campylobacterales bacterium]|nr:flagellar basal body-associated FliL family protein [Campylobacterales bacterium]